MTTLNTLTPRGLGRVLAVASCLVVFSMSLFAQKVTFGQQVAVMKVLKADLKTIGVLAGNLTDKMTQDLTRAGMAQGITIVIAKPKDRSEVGSLYKKLVTEKKIQMLWLPDGGDETVMGVSIDYLKENTAMDGVGLCVTEKKLVSSGALCSVQSENGKLIAYVNKKIATVVGASIPGEGSDINFVQQ
jgi:hypothetical protein